MTPERINTPGPGYATRITNRRAWLASLIAFLLLLPAGCTSAPSGASSTETEGIEVYRHFPNDLPPGNIAVGPDGRMFMSVHGFYGEPAARVVELLADDQSRPYPNKDWAGAPKGPSGPGMNQVLGLRVDATGVLWMLDGQTPERPGRLIGWDTRTETLFREIVLTAPATKADTFLNDLAVDRASGTIYIADSAGAIIVVDIASGEARRRLDGHVSTTAEDIDMVVDGRVVTLEGAPARIGINPITIDARGENLFYGPMSGTSLYRIATADLRDTSLSASDLAARVERYGPKPVSDGSTVDSAGNVYITAVADNAIGVIDASGTYRVLYQSDAISWPDGCAVGADGLIYVTISNLHNSPPLNGGQRGEGAGLTIMRFRPLAPAAQGR